MSDEADGRGGSGGRGAAWCVGAAAAEAEATEACEYSMEAGDEEGRVEKDEDKDGVVMEVVILSMVM